MYFSRRAAQLYAEGFAQNTPLGKLPGTCYRLVPVSLVLTALLEKVNVVFNSTLPHAAAYTWHCFFCFKVRKFLTSKTENEIFVLQFKCTGSF